MVSLSSRRGKERREDILPFFLYLFWMRRKGRAASTSPATRYAKQKAQKNFSQITGHHNSSYSRRCHQRHLDFELLERYSKFLGLHLYHNHYSTRRSIRFLPINAFVYFC